MAVLHRALCTWFVCLIFLILLVLRLDERTRWSWFIVFIPMWLYDGILIVYLAFEMITYCRAPGGPGGRWANLHSLELCRFLKMRNLELKIFWHVFEMRKYELGSVV